MTMRLLTLLLFSAGLWANELVTINFTGLPATTAGGYYVGYIGGTLDGIPAQFLCDDLLHTTYVPSGPWQYEVSDLTDLSDVRFQGAQRVIDYEAAAILLYEWDHMAHRDSMAGDYNYAVWGLFAPGHDYGASATLRAQALLLAAQTGALQTAAFDGLRIYTPVNVAYSNQEFVGLTETPEPSTLCLPAAGLLLLLVGLRARR